VSAQSDKAQPERISRRKRKAPQRRIPTVIDEPERRPFLFGLGGQLNHREREMMKERVALFGGVALAVIVAAILGWGLLYDNVVKPIQQSQANAKPVAKIGSFTVTTGFFKRFVHFQSQELQSNISNLQQQESQLTGAKNAAQLSLVQQQISQAQSQLQSLPQNSLTALLDSQTVLQRYRTAGVKLNHSEVAKAMNDVKKSQGGKDFFNQFLTSSELSYGELQQIVTSQILEQKVQTAVGKNVAKYTTKVRASHILVKKKSLAEQLLARIRQGSNFAALAKKYSTDTGSAKLGGDLGYFAPHTMVVPFDKAAFSMKIGEIRLVHSQYGWHIIKVTGRERAKVTGSALQQEQQTAYATWLQKQQAVIGVQKYIKTADLPGKNEIPTVNPLTQPTVAAPITTPVAVSTVGAKPKTTSKPKK
jgi:foldase protein PrsA